MLPSAHGSTSGHSERHQLLDLLFGTHQVCQRDAAKESVDASLQLGPDRTDAARTARVAALGIDAVMVAVDLEGLVLARGHHVVDGHRRSVARQEVATLRAAYRLHDPGATEPEQDLLDVVGRQSLRLRQLARGDRPTARHPAMRQVDRDDQRVLGPGGDTHLVNIAPWQATGWPADPPATDHSPRRKAHVNCFARPALLGLTICLLASCGGVSNEPAPWQSEDAFPQLAQTPITDADYAAMEVSDLTGEILTEDERIGAIGGMVVDGDVLWLHSEITDPWLYLVDRRDGTYMTTAGRQGEGPGEFGLLSSISTDPAGGIWGNDLSTNRLTHLRSDEQVEAVRIVGLPADFTSTFR